MNGKKQGDDMDDSEQSNFVEKVWDPTKISHQKNAKCNNHNYTAVYRVKKDLMSMFNDPPPGIYTIPDEADLMLIHAIIVGPMETPYEGGLFYFIIRCPDKYPLEPPMVKLMTTDAGRVRFNPNLYQNGKVCLSILGTWFGPAWSPAQQIGSVLISIQSLMNEKPYYNEPGMRSERYQGEATHYNDIITHETLRVAVCGMLENDCRIVIPPSFLDILEENFLSFYEQYISIAESKTHLDGNTMRDPFCEHKHSTQFNFTRIIARLKSIHEKVSEKSKNKSESNEASSSSDSKTEDDDTEETHGAGDL